jgi:hypothetical protein
MDNIKIINKANGCKDIYLNGKKLSDTVEIDVRMYMSGQNPMTDIILKQEFVNANVIIEDEPMQGTGTWNTSTIMHDGDKEYTISIDGKKISEEMAKSVTTEMSKLNLGV